MLTVGRVLRHLPKDASLQQFCREVTHALRRKYRKAELDFLVSHPEERMAASVAVFSRLRRELWMVGDCQCLINGQLYDNPKPDEELLATLRAEEVRRQLAAGVTSEQLLTDDTARPTIIPRMLQSMQQQNIDYSVVDGFPIAMQHVRCEVLSFAPFELVLATDGYPFLLPTLAESEAALERQRAEDPLNIGRFKATKAFMKGNNSFDDRAYIRLRV